MDILLLLAFVVLPAEGARQIARGASLAVRALQHHEKALDLKQHFALAALHKVGWLIQGAIAEGQSVDSLAELRIHEKRLEQ